MRDTCLSTLAYLSDASTSSGTKKEISHEVITSDEDSDSNGTRRVTNAFAAATCCGTSEIVVAHGSFPTNTR